MYLPLVSPHVLWLQELDSLKQCDDLLKKLGVKGSLFGIPSKSIADAPAGPES